MIDTMAIKTHKDEVYQPIPFLEYEKMERIIYKCY